MRVLEQKKKLPERYDGGTENFIIVRAKPLQDEFGSFNAEIDFFRVVGEKRVRKVLSLLMWKDSI